MKKTTHIVINLLLLGSLWADVWHVHYKNAINAAKKGEWQEVIAQIQNAIEDSPEPKFQKKSYGLNYENYFPFYYLGLAYFRLTQYNKAEINLKKSFFYEEINKDKSYAGEAQRMLDDCHLRLNPVATEKPVADIKKEPVMATNEPENRQEINEIPVNKEPSHSESAKTDIRAQDQNQDDARRNIINTWLTEADVLQGQKLYDKAIEKYQEVLLLNPNQQRAKTGLLETRQLSVRNSYRDILFAFFSGRDKDVEQLSQKTIAQLGHLGQSGKTVHCEILKLMVLLRIKQALLNNWPPKQENEAVAEFLDPMLNLGLEVRLRPSRYISPRLVERYQYHISLIQQKNQ